MKMKILSHLVIFCFLVISIASCSVSNTNLATSSPRDSFVYIEQSVSYVICGPEHFSTVEGDEKTSFGCQIPHKGMWTASGVLIKADKEKNESYVLTAGHVCETPDVPKPHIMLIDKASFEGFTLDGDGHEAIVVAIDKYNDLCLMKMEYVEHAISSISELSPEPGDKLFNVAAPTGVWAPNMVLIFEGYFAGHQGKYMITSIPAAGGSSGSPIYNMDGEIVGILHSVNTRLANITYGAKLKAIKKFLAKHLPE
jgi:S1-C subfamily serine protease